MDYRLLRLQRWMRQTSNFPFKISWLVRLHKGVRADSRNLQDCLVKGFGSGWGFIEMGSGGSDWDYSHGLWHWKAEQLLLISLRRVHFLRARYVDWGCETRIFVGWWAGVSPFYAFHLVGGVLYLRGRGVYVLPFFVVSFPFLCLFEFAGLLYYLPGRDIFWAFTVSFAFV
jgi:hypothetical protein